MSVEPILSLQNVWVEYGDKIVLEKVDLDIQPGSFVSIVGPRARASRACYASSWGRSARRAG